MILDFLPKQITVQFAADCLHVSGKLCEIDKSAATLRDQESEESVKNKNMVRPRMMLILN